jgi:uncharacterized repeat protein (TIGR01451 family)
MMGSFAYKFAFSRLSGINKAGNWKTLSRLLFLITVMFSGVVAHAATPPDTVLTNTVYADYEIAGAGTTVSASNSITTDSRTPSTIRFYRINQAGVSSDIPPAEFKDGNGNWTSIDQITLLDHSVVNLPSSQKITLADTYTSTEPVIIELEDPDQNTDPNVRETVLVTLTIPETGDTEVLRLTETTPSSGIFRGAILTQQGTANSNNGLLTVAQGSQIHVNYRDQEDNTDATATSALIDPYGIIFSSATGERLNGASITLMNADTNQPAQVYAPDGVNTWPSTVISGQTVSDSANNQYAMATGEFRFPAINPGRYYLSIRPPQGYAFPTQFSNADLQGLPNGPFTLVTGSRGETFEAISAVHLDVPVDIFSGRLSVTKIANKNHVSIGDFIQYSIAINNNDPDYALNNVMVEDTLPPGFRYQDNTAELNGTPVAETSVHAHGRSLIVDIGNMPASSNATLTYIVKVSAGSRSGDSLNRAQAVSGTTASNVATAKVRIVDELMRDTAILSGRVYIGCDEKKSLAGVHIYMETGRSIVSDPQGFWHLEGVRPGTHVIQLDKDSLPDEYEPVLCKANSRHANRAYSQFVDVQGGTLWRTDFHVRLKQGYKQQANSINEKAKNPLDIFDKKYAETASPEFRILWPENRYVPPISSIKIIVQHKREHKVEVRLNGKKVSHYNFDSRVSNTSKTVSIDRWRGVDIADRDNKLLVILKDKQGREIARKTRTVHFSGIPVKAELVREKSRLIADGKITPEIVVRLTDSDGYRMRPGTNAYFSFENAEYEIQPETSKAVSLNQFRDGKYKFTIAADGLAHIRLKPTTKTGEARLRFYLENDRTQTIHAWLQPHLRDWIMVGFVEGTVGYNTLSGNMQTLRELDKKKGTYTNGKATFFAKGKVKGSYLLTIAYDSHKKKSEVGEHLEGNIDPDQWYSVYGDSSSSQYEAASSSKLYIKLEREQFYALFGDYRTDLTVTELSRYERTLNGIHSEYQGNHFKYNLFASETSQRHQRDEIPGDGTSGLYHLTRDIIPNSEVITLETRDRFHPEVIITQRLLARYADYDIDYDSRTLFFKFPIPGRDQNLNPNIIVVDYESEDGKQKTLTAGGRAAYVTDDGKLETGVSYIHEGREEEQDGDLLGIDITYKLNKETRIRAEIAHSKTDKSGDAWLLEAKKTSAALNGRAYIRQQDTGFGLGHQNASENGTRKAGIEADWKIKDKLTLKTDIYRQDNLDDDASRKQASIAIAKEFEHARVDLGLRHVTENGLDFNRKSNLLTLGGSITPDDGRVTIRSHLEKNLGGKSDSEAYPDRLIIGTDIKLNNDTNLFVEREITHDKEGETSNDRIGLATSLWEGARSKSSITREHAPEGDRTYATLGLSQHLQLSEQLNADINIDHAKTLKNTQVTEVDPDQSAINGSLNDDYTAVSLGLGWNDKDWGWTGRIEGRNGDKEDKINFRAGIIRQLSEGKDVSAQVHVTHSKTSSGTETRKTALSLGAAWHPFGNDNKNDDKNDDITAFNRLDLVSEKRKGAGENNTTRKIIHNIHINKKTGKNTQISLHHGIKHSIENIFERELNSTIDTGKLEIRKDISENWDIGLHAGYLHDWDLGNWEQLYGMSLGVSPVDDMWLSLGYNVAGFTDEDFSQSEYTAQGPFLRFRYRLDQDSLSSQIERLKGISTSNTKNSTVNNKVSDTEERL